MRPWSWLLGLWCVLGLGLGCSPDSPPVGPCGLPYLGDARQPLSFAPTAVGLDLKSGPLEEGGKVALLVPPQGGRVAFIGVGEIGRAHV